MFSAKTNFRIVLLAFVLSKRYFPYYPAPDNSPDWRWRTGITVLLRGSYSIASTLRDYHSNELGLWYLRTFMPPNHGSNIETREDVFDFGKYRIHVWRQIESNHDKVEPAVLFFHGGGWMLNDVAMHRRFYSNIAVATQMTVAAVAYRRSDIGVFPVAFTDCYDAAVEIMTNSAKYKIDDQRIVISGDSAGGQLALSVGMELTQNGFAVKGIVPLYPVTQIVTSTTRSYMEKDYAIIRDGVAWAASMYVYGDLRLLKEYQNGEVFNAALSYNKDLISDRFQYNDEDYTFAMTTKSSQLDNRGFEAIFDVRVSPLLASDSVLKDLPPTHIYAAEHDVLRDDSILFYNAAKKAGNLNIKLTLWKGAYHMEQAFTKYWLNFSIMPQSDSWMTDYLNTIVAFANA